MYLSHGLPQICDMKMSVMDTAAETMPYSPVNSLPVLIKMQINVYTPTPSIEFIYG